jgi:outer membrane protein
MKHSLLAAAALAAAFSTSALAQSAQPPSAPTPASVPTGAKKLAVIAFQPAVMSTNEGRQDIEKIRQKFEPEQAKLKALNDEINALKKKMQSAGSSLSQDQRASQLQTIDSKEKSLQRQAEDDQSDFRQAMTQSYQSIAQKFYAVLQTYAAQHHYDLVLDSSSQETPVVWFSKTADITKAVVDAYNEKSGVSAPAAAPAAGATHGAAHKPATHKPAAH